MPEYLVERYQPGLAADGLRADARRLAEATAALRRDGAAIELLGLTYLPGDEGVFERFASSSEDLVARVHERAAIPYERIVEAQPVDI